MKEYICFSDLHFGAAKPDHKKYDIKNLKFGPNVIYNGDIYDFYGMKKSELPYWNAEYLKFVNKCRETGTTYIGGNHEVCKNRYRQSWFVTSTTIVTHGDLVFWKKKKSDKWRNKTELGASNWKRKLIYLKNLLWTRSLVKEKKAIVAAKWALKRDICYKRIIVGYTYTPKMQIFNVLGVEVIFLPQGESKVMF